MRKGERLLKTDSRGRVQTPPERREMLLDEFEQTGASAAAFARLVGVRYSTFAAWVQRRRKERTTEVEPRMLSRSMEPAALKWVEASVDVPGVAKVAATTALSVHLPGGARMEISDAAQVLLAAELLRALAAAEGRVAAAPLYAGGAGC
jgi:hypothetical protein